MKLFYKIILLFILFKVESFAQKSIDLVQNTLRYDLIYSKVEVFEDKTNRLNLSEIRNTKFSIYPENAFNNGYSNSKFWYRLKLNNKANHKWIFVILGSLIDKIEFFEIGSDGNFTKRITGDHYPHGEREIDSPIFAFHLNLAQNESKEIYFSLESKDPKQFTLFVEEINYFNRSLHRAMYRWFIYFGMLLMMALYNLLLYFSIRDKTYLYYVLYIISFGLFQFTVFGYSAQFLWPDNIWLTNRATPIFAGLSTIFISIFSYKFLNIKVLYSKLSPFFYYLILSGAIISAIFFFEPSAKSNFMIALISFIDVVILVSIGTYIWWKGYVPARYYMIAWAVLLFSLAVFILNSAKLLPQNPFNYLILPFGGIVEVVMLSFALGSRINEIEKEKTNAQTEVVKQLKNNELVRSRIARDLHDDLGSTLSSINILSEFAKKENRDHPEKIPQLLNKIAESTQKLQENLQDIVWTTQNADNKIDNLLVRMRLFAGEIFELKSIEYQIDIDKKLNGLTLESDMQYDIFMIFKEAINNIVKYAEAKEVGIKFYLEENIIYLKINDKGKGFDITSEKTGNGLKNMKQRADINGFKINILSEIGKGTCIELGLPVPQ